MFGKVSHLAIESTHSQARMLFIKMSRIVVDYHVNIPNLISFRYALVAYQASFVEPCFVHWRDAVEPKHPWRDQTSLICNQCVHVRYNKDVPCPNSSGK